MDWLNETLFLIGTDEVSLAELLGFVFGAAAVALAAAERLSNFPVGIAMSLFFGVLFLDAQLYANAALQVVYVVLGAGGWWAWRFGGSGRSSLRVTRPDVRDIPFVQDGLRDGEHLRSRMTERFRQRLAARREPYVEVSGTHPERTAQATAAVDDLLRWEFAPPLQPARP